ncbi:MAG TPA: DMT family transporter [Anaerolineales bacterium]|nr:DMT family transporter [Anaerolineales bacterium]
MLSVLYGLASSLSWGAADFIGGLASKTTSPYRVLYLAEIAGLIPFLALALLTGEALPSAADLLWGACASIIGLMGLLLLYRALAEGQMTIAAPVSALLAALIPVIFGLFTLEIPPWTTLIGFGFALLAVWLVSQNDSTTWRFAFSDLRLPLLSGFFFGLYFLTLHKATLNAFFWPLVSARFAGFVAIGLFALITRRPAMPPREVWGYSLFNGVIDIAGNGFYILAAQTGRLDVAAVLSSLYPAATALLAWIFLKERLTFLQTIGVCFAFTAIILFIL